MGMSGVLAELFSGENRLVNLGLIEWLDVGCDLLKNQDMREQRDSDIVESRA